MHSVAHAWLLMHVRLVFPCKVLEFELLIGAVAAAQALPAFTESFCW